MSEMIQGPLRECEFRCDECGGIFEHEEDWTEEKRLEELAQNFPGKWDMSEMSLVCCVCYEETLDRVPIEVRQLPPEVQKELNQFARSPEGQKIRERLQREVYEWWNSPEEVQKRAGLEDRIWQSILRGDRNV